MHFHTRPLVTASSYVGSMWTSWREKEREREREEHTVRQTDRQRGEVLQVSTVPIFPTKCAREWVSEKVLFDEICNNPCYAARLLLLFVVVVIVVVVDVFSSRLVVFFSVKMHLRTTKWICGSIVNAEREREREREKTGTQSMRLPPAVAAAVAAPPASGFIHLPVCKVALFLGKIFLMSVSSSRSLGKFTR